MNSLKQSNKSLLTTPRGHTVLAILVHFIHINQLEELPTKCLYLQFIPKVLGLNPGHGCGSIRYNTLDLDDKCVYCEDADFRAMAKGGTA